MADVPSVHQDMAAGRAAFTAELRTLTGVLDPDAGWYAAFARREGGELADWLSGRRLPPWDAVADLLQDLAGRQGTAVAERVGRRLRSAYESAVDAEDALPGSRGTLTGRLAELDRRERELQGRERQLSAAMDVAQRAGQSREADRLATLKLWAQDDAGRVLSRRAELRSRLAALGAGAGGTEPAGAPPGPGAAERQETGQKNAGKGRKKDKDKDKGKDRAKKTAARRPRGARFAGLDETAEPGPPAVTAAAPEAAVAPAPGGSRFAGAVREVPRERPVPRLAAEDRQAALDTAERLRRLRADGQGGAAHVLLCEAAGGSAVRLPVLVAELERTGMLSDVTTLLWEAALLPAGPLAAAAEALAAAGRAGDCGQLLRQAAARPAAEAGSIAAELCAAGHESEAITLLAALVRSRTAEEAVRAAAPAPGVVVPLLLDAARTVSAGHHWAVTSELRRAGMA
ncbi:hypothetical protein [Streptomyces sp. MP131-18]|uniref:hypothetical protein n=1 Tax=Streptomyces sp. MP131-18 TaxID=1857892 RepID=UPI0009CDB79C|nr:hypothetical protein [Streptomyces sp. MP131-18]ONK10570.1 hypothetical protein STBA_12920 [Streptomyces sp. MP131-18]